MDKNTNQFLGDKYAKEWIEKNKDMLDDYYKICHDIIMFKAMWGINIGIVFKDYEETKGRGSGTIEEVLDAQDFTNQQK